MTRQQPSLPEKKSEHLLHRASAPFKSLLFPFLLIVVLVIVGTSWVSYYVHRRALQQSLIQQVEVQMRTVSAPIQMYLQNQLDTLMNDNRSIAGQYNIRREIYRILDNPHRKDFGTELHRLLIHNDYELRQENVSLLDDQGRQIFNYGNNSIINSADVDIAAALKGLEFSNIIKEGKLWRLRSLVPLREGKRTRGVLVLTLGLNIVLNEYASQNQMNLAIADRNGIQALSTNIVLDHLNFDPIVIEQVLDGTPIHPEINLQHDRHYHFKVLTIGTHRFVLITEIGLGHISQILQQKKQEVIHLTLIMLALLLPFSLWLVRLLLNPLNELRQRVAGVTQKLSGISLEDYHGHEIKRLVGTFDGMAAALEEHEEARQQVEELLKQERASLEVKIKERTQEMELTNDLLQREIGERTRTQLKAEGLQKLLTGIIDAMPSMLIGIDRQGRITQWNLETQKISDLSLEQVKGDPFYEALPCLKPVRVAIEQTLREETPQKLSHVNWPANPSDQLMDVMIYPLDAEQGGGAVIRIDNVTERTRFDEMIMQTEKMVSVGGLAAGMAHEINNPLASIIQSAQIIKQRLSPEMPKNISCAENLGIPLESINSYLNERQIPNMVTTILDSGQRAGEIVKSMLNFTQGNDPSKSAQKITELLEQAIEHAKKDYNLKKHHHFQQITIIRDYAEELPVIFCNAGQIEQVFFNLLQNSAQALSTRAPDEVPPQIRLRVGQEEQMLVISLSDNGPGISSDIQKRIFEPFFTTKDIGMGTGLGLSVTYFIVTEIHGGQLRVDSEPNKGCSFTIHLPLGQPPTSNITQKKQN
ncbi:sensor histidine kinase [Geopsychrobacter electrodiphilus]|uniref:sensor histidine kinase n=1 Tax=Geopsychrobacter electrodiphilus TaxID=225196 RepID=UPI000376EAEC|nr:PAS domain-containing sensor histidine kinase [Geopsychrobacter electrodiphilus]